MITATERQRRITVGEKLKKLRMSKGLKQADMARKLSVSPTSYMLYEQGKQEPSIRNLINISEILDTSIDKLLSREPNSILNYDLDSFFEAKNFWEIMGYNIKVVNNGVVNLYFPITKDTISFTKSGSVTFIPPKSKSIIFDNKDSFIKFTNNTREYVLLKFHEQQKEICTDIVSKLYEQSIKG